MWVKKYSIETQTALQDDVRFRSLEISPEMKSEREQSAVSEDCNCGDCTNEKLSIGSWRGKSMSSESSVLGAVENMDQFKLRQFKDNYSKTNMKQSRGRVSFNQLNTEHLGLVGREEQIKTMTDAFERIAKGEGPRIATVKGAPGTGKTALAQELRNTVEKASGFFCTGEYETNRNEPYIGFLSALSDLSRQIISRGQQYTSEFVNRVEEAIGCDIPILLDFIPDLKKVGFGNQGVFENSLNEFFEGSVANKANQLHLILRKFVKALCNQETPLVIVLDDLQWADPSSLLLISSLGADVENNFFLLVTTSCSIGEEDQAISSFFTSLNTQQITVEEIQTMDLQHHEVHCILCTTLRSTDDKKIEPLTDVIYDKTHGNPFFLLVFLQSLVDEDLLEYNVDTLSFIWELESIRKKSATDNVGDIAASNLAKFRTDISLVLKVAASLSRTFERHELAFTIEGIKRLDHFKDIDWPESLDDVLRMLTDQRILISQQSNTLFSFSHYQTKATVLNLIPYKQRDLLQLAVGQRLIEYMKDHVKLEKYICLATDLCNVGLKLVKEEEILDFAKWNLVAGDFSLRKAAFSSALKYFDIGILCLGKDYWRNQPRLALALHCGAAEAAYCCGDYERSERYSQAVLESDYNFSIEESIRIFRAQISALGAQQRFEEAVDVARYALKELGIDLPQNPGIFRVLNDVVKTKRLARGQTLETLLSLPKCNDQKRVLAMSIINHLSTMAYTANPNFFLIMYLKSVRWTIKYGYTEYSPVALSTYGLIVQSAHFGNAGLELAKVHNLRLPRATAISAHYGYVYHWSQEMRKCLVHLAYGHQLAMEAGETEIAFLCISNHDGIMISIGSKNLPDLAHDMEMHNLSMDRYKQDAMKLFHAVLWQFSLNMMGECENPKKLTGRAMDENELRGLARIQKNWHLDVFLDFWRCQLAYFMGDYHAAGNIAQNTMGYGIDVGQSSPYVTRHTFIVGLIHAALAANSRAKEDRKKHLKVASAMNKRLNAWVKKGHKNCLHMSNLIKAEILALSNDAQSAEDAYEEAIMATTQVGFVNDRALAHERTAMYFMSAYPNDDYKALHHLKNALDCYREWGAMLKVNDLHLKYGTMLDNDESSISMK